jgi:hypothetical protein
MSPCATFQPAWNAHSSCGFRIWPAPGGRLHGLTPFPLEGSPVRQACWCASLRGRESLNRRTCALTPSNVQSAPCNSGISLAIPGERWSPKTHSFVNRLQSAPCRSSIYAAHLSCSALRSFAFVTRCPAAVPKHSRERDHGGECDAHYCKRDHISKGLPQPYLPPQVHFRRAETRMPKVRRWNLRLRARAVLVPARQ